MTEEEIRVRLDGLKQNGWTWALISTVTPGIVRIRLVGEVDETIGRSIEEPTFQEALIAAENFVKNTTFYEYARVYLL